MQYKLLTETIERIQKEQEGIMNRYTFIDGLRKALSGEINSNIIEENVLYYEEYIDMEVRKGKTEEEVLDILGDPRLLAKTILETNHNAELGADYDAPHFSNSEEQGSQGTDHRGFRIPWWLILILVIFILGILLRFSIALFFRCLPLIILIWLISGIVKFFRR